MSTRGWWAPLALGVTLLLGCSNHRSAAAEKEAYLEGKAAIVR